MGRENSNEAILDLLKGILRRVKALEDSMGLEKHVRSLEKELKRKDDRIKDLENEISRFTQGENLDKKVNKLMDLFAECKETQLKILKQMPTPKETTESEELSVNPTSPPPTKDEWANGMTLFGDELWKNFKEHSSIGSLFKKDFPSVRISAKEGQNLFGLFDDKRGQIVVPLPAQSRTFVLSIGARDLRESSLISLKKGSLEEVRKHNFPILNKKASTLKALIQKILSISPDNSVVLVFPPRGYDERIEVHLQWEEIVKDTLKIIPFPKIKILHLPILIKSTQSEFDGDKDFRLNWFGSKKPGCNSPLKLGQYGAQKLFYELHRTILAQSPTIINMDVDWPIIVEETSDSKKVADICARCTRKGHSSAQCRSKDKLCRNCGMMGHFVEVHDVTDTKFREIIVQTLGVDIYAEPNEESCAKKPRLEFSEAMPTVLAPSQVK